MAPSREVPATVTTRDGHVMSFWTYLKPPARDRPTRRRSARCCGTCTASCGPIRLHSRSSPPLGDIPAFLARPQTLLDCRRRRPPHRGIQPADRATSRRRRRRPGAGAARRCRHRATSWRPAASWVWHDFEDTCCGPGRLGSRRDDREPAAGPRPASWPPTVSPSTRATACLRAAPPAPPHHLVRACTPSASPNAGSGQPNCWHAGGRPSQRLPGPDDLRRDGVATASPARRGPIPTVPGCAITPGGRSGSGCRTGRTRIGFSRIAHAPRRCGPAEATVLSARRCRARPRWSPRARRRTQAARSRGGRRRLALGQGSARAHLQAGKERQTR